MTVFVDDARIPAEDPIVIPGDLIAAAVVEACSRILAPRWAEQAGEDTLLILSGTPGVVVTRGPDGEPWPPQPKVRAPVEAVVPGTPPEEPWQLEHYRPQIPEQVTRWVGVPAFRWEA